MKWALGFVCLLMASCIGQVIIANRVVPTAVIFSGPPEPPAPPPFPVATPPHSPSIWFEFSVTNGLTLTGTAIDAATNLMGGASATNFGSLRPTYKDSLVVSNGPSGRARFAGTSYLELPTSYTFNRRTQSVVVVSRAKDFGRGVGFHTPTETSGLAVYAWDNTELLVWKGSSAVSANLGLGHGASVQWASLSDSNAMWGTDNLYTNQSSAFSAGTFTGARIGRWNGTSFTFPGDMQSVVIYDKALTLSQVNDVLQWAHTNYHTASTNNDTVIVFDGDSRTEGVITSNPQNNPSWLDWSYPLLLQGLCTTSTPRVVNVGHGGGIFSNYVAATDPIRYLGWNRGMTYRIVFGLWGHNDLQNGYSSNSLKASLDTWISNIRAADPGAIVGHGTLWRSDGLDAADIVQLNGFNNYITSGIPDLDFTINLADVPILTNTLDTTYWFDKVHATERGYYEIAKAVRNALLNLGFHL